MCGHGRWRTKSSSKIEFRDISSRRRDRRDRGHGSTSSSSRSCNRRRLRCRQFGDQLAGSIYDCCSHKPLWGLSGVEPSHSENNDAGRWWRLFSFGWFVGTFRGRLTRDRSWTTIPGDISWWWGGWSPRGRGWQRCRLGRCRR